jgi:hypothetical protein
MNDDLLSRVAAFLEIHELPESTGLMQELVAEIKRLREASHESRQMQENEIKRLSRELAKMEEAK